MNRHERRRRAKLGDIVEIKLGRVVFDIKPGDDVSRDICFVCGKPATAWLIPEGRAGPIPEGSMAHCCARSASIPKIRPAARSFASTGTHRI